MPEIKIFIDNEEYSLQCELGEEMELEKAASIVNEKMSIFKDEINLKKTTKFLMVSLLLASESMESKDSEDTDKQKIVKIEQLVDKLISILDVS